MFKTPVQTAPFIEHPISNNLFAVYEYDIIAYDDLPPDFLLNNKFNLQQYCACLLQKLFSLNKSKIKPFLQYQCEQLSDPFTWLNKLEKLIDLNRELFITKESNIKIEKTLVIIEVLRQDTEQNKHNKGKYDFIKVKAKLKQYQTPEEQLSFLYEAQAEYLQNKPVFINSTETPFDQKITIEIDKIERQEQLKKRIPERTNILKNNSPIEKIPVNGHINILVDAFYQMLYEKKANGDPYLGVNASVIVKLLSNHFIDKDGHPLSENTIRTILNPNKPEKRPKGDAKMQL